MAKLTAKTRDKMSAAKFGEPANKGKLSGAAERSIDRKADQVIERLGKPKRAR